MEASRQRALDRWSNRRRVKRRKELQRLRIVRAMRDIRIKDGKAIWARDVKKGEVVTVPLATLQKIAERPAEDPRPFTPKSYFFEGVTATINGVPIEHADGALDDVIVLAPTVGESLDAMHAHLVDVEEQLYGEASPSVVVTAEPPSPADAAERTAPAITITINGEEVPATIVKDVAP
jgi:hypothetical protein